ncbi:SOS response-associated peptidase family protein [Tunturiibacter gelidiferens]|uniref:SOS response-associated peptidase family protein n=1 Tax=Tunturiibacter gelidiferens TaxID=3069689 RepID=UPI003D9BD1FB
MYLHEVRYQQATGHHRAYLRRRNLSTSLDPCRSREPMAFAGLWERWNDPRQSVPLETFSIITTDPNELMQSIHPRMPVIVPKADWSRWLDPVETLHSHLLISSDRTRQNR